MQIIPVIDLSKGLVVHAFKGERQNYKAIDSQICSSAMPSDVIDGFLNIYNFKSMYIADLDALLNQGDHADLIQSICYRYKNVTFWLDCGISSIDYYMRSINVNNLRYIISSESISSLSIFTSLLNTHPNQDFILSLDFKADQLLGASELLFAKESWPNELIVLNLSEVGANSGFVYPTFIKNNKIAESFKLNVGGGIRNIDDIANLQKQGIEGALISTALHSKAIDATEITELSRSL